MNFLNDVITYVRRIIKSPSDAVITDNLIIDYINRFWIMDVDARMQLFDLKTKYSFMTSPGVDKYNMPLYNVQPEGGQSVGLFPVYQGFLGPAYINGVPILFETQKASFFNYWMNITQNMQGQVVGNGTAGPYTITMPIVPNSPTLPNPFNPPYNAILRGHVDITGIISTGNNVDPPLADNTTGPASIPAMPSTSVDSAVYITSIDATGANVVVADSGQFLTGNVNYGLLMHPGNAPYGNQALPPGSDGKQYSTLSNTINYFTGIANVTFHVAIPIGMNINAQCYFFQTGLPRSILYYNNVLTLRAPPAFQYLVELQAYLSPAAFFNSNAAIPFGYMAEYIARGAARKILSDTGDIDQFMFYEPLFKEQEMLVWKRSQRQWTANRTETVYSHGSGFGQSGNNSGLSGGSWS